MQVPYAAEKGKTLLKLIDKAKSERKAYDETATAIDQYINDMDYKFLYQNGTDPNLSFYARVSLMGQAVDMFVPQIVSANPHRMVHVRNATDMMTKARAELMGRYLNRIPDETDLYEHNCKAAAQGIAHGRAVMWTGWNPRKKLVQSVFDDDKNLFLDPDAKSIDRINWCARKRERPRWELLALPGIDQSQVAALQDTTKSASEATGIICHYEVYLRVGISRYMEGVPDTVDAPMKYVISEDGKLLSEGPWEIPWHLDDAWPFEVCDLRDSWGSLWPKSPLEPGLGHQRALNFLYTDFVSKVRASARILMAVLNINGTGPSDDDEAAMFDLMNRWPVMKINVNGLPDGTRIQDFFQQMKIDAGIDEFQRAYGLIKNEFEEHTGFYSIFHAGHQDKQSRSAADTEMKDRNSRTRLDAYQHKFERFQSKLARKEALAARFLHSPEEIDAVLGTGSGDLWGQIMPPADAGMMGGVDFEQFFRETDYSIETGSLRRRNIEQQIDLFDKIHNTVTSVQLGSPDLMEKATAYDTIAESYKVMGMSEEIIQKQKDLANYFRQQHEAMMAAQQAQEQMAAMGAPMGAPPAEAPL